nr:serum amyloid A-4 protein-like [Peromyscus maniculatus bairdii]
MARPSDKGNADVCIPCPRLVLGGHFGGESHPFCRNLTAGGAVRAALGASGSLARPLASSGLPAWLLRASMDRTWDLWRAHRDNLEANYRNSDRYFSARGNFEAQQRGAGGVWAAKIISTSRKCFQGLLNRYYFGMKDHGSESLESTRKAEEWGHSGKHPDRFRPQGLPGKF